MTAKYPDFFAFYPQDFACDGKVEAMSTLAAGAYILLLCKAWYENPPGTLPDDDSMLARWSRVNADTWIQIKSEVVAAFRFANGRWVQKRMVNEFRKAKRLIKARSDGGKSTAAKRWGSGSSATGGQPQPDQTRPDKNLVKPAEPPSDLAGWLGGIGIGEPGRGQIVGSGIPFDAIWCAWSDSQTAKAPARAFMGRMKKQLGIGRKSGVPDALNALARNIRANGAVP